MKKSKKWDLIITLIALVLCLVVSLIVIKDYFSESDEMKQIQNEAYTEETDPEADKTENYVETPVSFTELKQQNEDIYGWINIPDTVIDYPILRHKQDNSFYLNHSVTGKSSVYGSIYTEKFNSIDFDDFNTVIYGHNMKNGTMFGSLKRFRNKSYFDKNRYINIYTPGRILKYEIFAAYVSDDRHIFYKYDFSNHTVRDMYIEEIFSKTAGANIRPDIEVTRNDKIITLSTCTNVKTERYLVQAVLVYDSKNIEE